MWIYNRRKPTRDGFFVDLNQYLLLANDRNVKNSATGVYRLGARGVGPCAPGSPESDDPRGIDRTHQMLSHHSAIGPWVRYTLAYTTTQKITPCVNDQFDA